MGMAKKELDRHVDPETVNFTFPAVKDELVSMLKIGKKDDPTRTRASMIREAIREWIARRER